MFVVFFFFKQKTAYEMRISDWSSDVCSSDLVENDAGEPVSADNHAIDIDANGDGWVRMSSGPTTTIRVRYQAGMAADWNGVPEPLRQGIVRLVAHMHLHRDGDQSPPAAVAALWRPWRRMRLK